MLYIIEKKMINFAIHIITPPVPRIHGIWTRILRKSKKNCNMIKLIKILIYKMNVVRKK